MREHVAGAVAEEHYKGEAVEWMRGTCIDMMGEDIARAHAAYRKAMAEKRRRGPKHHGAFVSALRALTVASKELCWAVSWIFRGAEEEPTL